MTSELDKEQRLHDTEMSALDSEEDALEDQNWDDWELEDDLEGEGCSKSELLCLFCHANHTTCDSLFRHCVSAHHFDFYGIKKAHGLDFYRCFKLINYVRSQVSESKCWCCMKRFSLMEELQNHLQECSLEGNTIPWDDERFLNPFLQDDALLYSFDECDEFDDENGVPVTSEELDMHMLQIEHLHDASEGSSKRCTSQIFSPFENEAKQVESIHDNGDGNERSLRIAENKIKNINKDYFGSYSSFGIHRDMISDKIRTDAYREAILANPSLMRGAVVMDLGCGTGILSLFAAQAGAARVIAVEASNKMALVATQIAKDNGLLCDRIPDEGNQGNGVIEVVQGMVEELGNANHIKPHSIDVLLSEWMGYCLLYESMLSSVIFARDHWLKPGGAILPDTATLFVAGFGKGGTSIPFWENVYGFNMTCIGKEVVEDAAQVPIVDIIDSRDIVTTSKVLQFFDLATMQPKQMDFTATVELEPKLDAPMQTTWCYGVVLWFDTGFTERFCSDKPVVLSTSPYGPNTHWSQTVLTFREPIAIALDAGGAGMGSIVGSNDCPSVKIQSRISIARAVQHRCIDISLELTGIRADGQSHSWPAQLFNLK